MSKSIKQTERDELLPSKEIVVSPFYMTRFELLLSWRLALREAIRNKFNFLLGLLTVFMVVGIVAILVSVIDYAPLIFLGLSEQMQGQIDLHATLLNNYGPNMRFNVTQIPFAVAPRYTQAVNVYSASNCQNFNSETPLDSSTFYPSFSNCGTNNINTCLFNLCGAYSQGNILAFDHDKEKSFGIGTSYPFEKLKPNQVILGSKLAGEMDLKVNDYIVIPQSVDYQYLTRVYNASIVQNVTIGTSLGNIRTVINIAQIVAITDIPYRKTTYSSNDFIFQELSEFPAMQVAQMHPSVSTEFKDLFLSFSSQLDQFTTEMVVPCAKDRETCYSSASYDAIANNINPWASNIRSLLGYDEVTITVPLLVYLQDQRFFISMLNLLLSLVVAVLGSISVFLIYSLLMVSVETKIFETGISRMIGFKKINVYATLILQGLSYSIPGVVFGLVASQIAFIFVGQYLNNLLQVTLTPRISSRGVLISFLLGFFIPIFASIIPVKKALSYNIHDALDQRQSTFKPIKISIERSKSYDVPVYQVFGGLIAVSVGFSVYYLLPVALINGDIVLMFDIFFIILVMMLIGLTILSINFESIVQGMLLDMLFIIPFEKKSMKQLINRNLLAHKNRNKKTTLIFAVALSFIIFLTVAGDIQLSNLDFTKRRKSGTVYSITTNSYFSNGQASGIPNYLKLEAFLLTRNEVLDIGYSTYALADWDAINFKSTKISNLGQTVQYTTNLFAVSPNFLEIMDINFVEMSNSRNKIYSPVESLYGLRNSKSLIMGGNIYDNLYLDSLKDEFVVTLQTQQPNGHVNTTVNIFQTEAVFSSFPFFAVSQYSSRRPSTITDLFTLYDMAGWNFTGLANVPLRYVFIQTKPLNAQEEFIFLRDLATMVDPSTMTINNISPDLNTAAFAKNALSVMFQCISVMIILLMFFSLNSSMSVNIMEQKKEIGILRSLGLTAFEIFRLYIFEATILVLSAGLLG